MRILLFRNYIRHILKISPTPAQCYYCKKKPRILTKSCGIFTEERTKIPAKLYYSRNLSIGDPIFLTLIGCRNCNHNIGYISKTEKDSKNGAICIWNEEENYWSAFKFD